MDGGRRSVADRSTRVGRLASAGPAAQLRPRNRYVRHASLRSSARYGVNSEYRSLRGSNGVALEPDPRLLERLAALAVVARLARGDEVLPGVAAAAVARDDVVEGQVVGLAAAVLAGVAVAREDLAPGQLDPRPRPPDLVLEPDDGRRAELGPRRPDDLVVVLDHLGLLAEHEPERPRQVPDVQRLVVLVQHEHDAVHRRARMVQVRRFAARAADRRRRSAGSQPPAWPTFDASGLPRASAMNRAASRTPLEVDTPCS